MAKSKKEKPYIAPPNVQPNWFLGVDCGAKGAACLLSEERSVKPLIYNFAADDWKGFSKWVLNNVPGECVANTFCLIEKVTGNTRGIRGGAHASETKSFQFGFNVGVVYGILAYDQFDLPIAEVTPTVWQKAFGLSGGSKTESTSDKKGRHQLKARQRFPSVRDLITKETADAVLIASYLRSHYKELF